MTARKLRKPSPEEIVRGREDKVNRLCRWYCSTLFAANELFDESWRLADMCVPGGELEGLIDHGAMYTVVRGLETAWGALANSPPVVLGPYRLRFNV